MPIAKGEPWGRRGLLPVDAPVAWSDAAAARHHDDGCAVVALADGDLCRTLGGRGDVADRLGHEVTLLDVDVGELEIGTRVTTFVAHVVARGRWWLGPAMVAMNAEWVHDLRLGPRSHPGDGLLDVTTGRLRVGELAGARTRARTGDHVPHPRLTVDRVAEMSWECDRARLVFVDGERLPATAALTVRVRPAALTVAV